MLRPPSTRTITRSLTRCWRRIRLPTLITRRGRANAFPPIRRPKRMRTLSGCTFRCRQQNTAGASHTGQYCRARWPALVRRLEAHLLPLLKDLFHEILESAFFFILQVLFVQQQGVFGIFDRVVRGCLNVDFEHVPCQEAERELALAGRQGVDVDCVNDLGWRNVDV